MGTPRPIGDLGKNWLGGEGFFFAMFCFDIEIYNFVFLYCVSRIYDMSQFVVQSQSFFT